MSALRFILTAFIAASPSSVFSSSIACDIRSIPGLCDGNSDDTAALQAALTDCPRTGAPIFLRAGAKCISQPLVLTSHTVFHLEANATIIAGKKWAAQGGDIRPFMLARSVMNVTIAGQGTLDGNGSRWWPMADLPRPRLLVFQNASEVELRDFTLLNSPFWTLLLGGRNFKVSGIRIRAPNWGVAPNTDGIDVAADGVHITGVDISNGDDSICIKSPSSNVLVENSFVSSGNGLVVGTAADGLSGDAQYVANVSNVTFRNCVANDTTFGCHIKYRFMQHGHVKGITFENITIYQTAASTARRIARHDWAGYAIGLHQDDQGASPLSRTSTPVPVFVRIEDVTYRNITANVLHAGQFKCSPLTHLVSPCRNIVLENVHINASVDGCIFSEIYKVKADDVTPLSCSRPGRGEGISALPIHEHPADLIV